MTWSTASDFSPNCLPPVFATGRVPGWAVLTTDQRIPVHYGEKDMITVILEGKRHDFAAEAFPVLDLKKLSNTTDTAEAPITVARIDGVLQGLATQLVARVEAYEVEFFNAETEEGLTVLRHSTCHAMAQAVERIFGKDKVKFGVGPATDDGFYQDFLLTELTEAHLPLIEKEMERIKEENFPFERCMVSPAQAVTMFAEDPLKIEIIENLIETQGDNAMSSFYVQKEQAGSSPRRPHPRPARGRSVPSSWSASRALIGAATPSGSNSREFTASPGRRRPNSTRTSVVVPEAGAAAITSVRGLRLWGCSSSYLNRRACRCSCPTARSCSTSWWRSNGR